jgi:DNA-binding beta-propeller fold protein YncE
MTFRSRHTRIAALAMTAIACAAPLGARAQTTYERVEHWASLPGGAVWGQATGVDLDSHGNIYVFQRDPARPIVVFDTKGAFLRTWGQGLFTTGTHFLRVDRDDNVWVTDKILQQVFKFTSGGRLLMTLGQRGVAGDNTTTDRFNAPADIALAENGDIFLADGESSSTRVLKFSKSGAFIRMWGTPGTGPGQFNTPHSIAIDARGRLYVADRANNRVQVFDEDGAFVREFTNVGTPWGLFITPDGLLYVVDGTEKNCLVAVDTADGRIRTRIDGLATPHAVAVAPDGTVYIAETTGMDVKKFVPARRAGRYQRRPGQIISRYPPSAASNASMAG